MVRGVGKRQAKLALAGSVATLGIASVALATTQPTLVYKPPTITVIDHPQHDSVENIVVRREDEDFTFLTPSQFFVDPDSDEGCEYEVSTLHCPREGVEKILIRIGGLDDEVSIKLGRSARQVKQIVNGQEGDDDLFGGPGKQKLLGGPGDDELYGESGRDLLNGGKGTDICVGDERDTFKDCESVPVR
jgi:hypothetical protein